MESCANEKVSIIMPVYNCEKYLSDAVNSVLAQSYKNWDLFICDDQSTDHSLQIAKDHAAKDGRIKVLKNEYNSGAPGARNTCLKRAEGRYIAFLDADDIWYPSKLELQINCMRSKGSGFVYSYFDVMDESGEHCGTYKTPKMVDAKKIRYSNFMHCLTVMYDTEIFGKVPQPEIKKRNDYALWLKMFSQFPNQKAYGFSQVTACYRENNYGLSNNKYHALKYYRRCLVQYGNVGIMMSFYYTCVYLFLSLLKKKFSGLYNSLIVHI